jgi:hypothetical protein
MKDAKVEDRKNRASCEALMKFSLTGFWNARGQSLNGEG